VPYPITSQPASSTNEKSNARIARILGHLKDGRFEKATIILEHLANMLATTSDVTAQQNAMIAAWTEMRETVLSPSDNLEIKRKWFERCYAKWDEAAWGKPPVWEANLSRLKQSNTYALMQEFGVENYDALYQCSLEQGKTFWSGMTRRLGIPFKNDFTPTHTTIVNAADPREPQWFPGAKLNIADAFFQASPDKIAIVYRKEGSTATQTMTYGELNAASNRVASALENQGFKKGDAIAIDMPMNQESIIIFIGILKMGGTLVSLADSFKEADIALRLQQIPSGVKAIFTQDLTGKNPLYSVIKNTPNAPKAFVITTPNHALPDLRSGDMHWADFMMASRAEYESVAMDSNDNLNVIFSSSTSTGKEKEGEAPKAPKAIPWKAHTFIKSAVDAHLHHDMQPHKTLCWPTNLGWMMGAFDIAAAFMNQGTLALYDGRPVTREFGRFVQDAKVNILGLVPALAEQWEQSRCMEGLNWSRIERFSSTGSPSLPANYFYLMSLVPKFAPVIEYMGGTEIGGGYITNTEFKPFVPSQFNTATLGTPLVIAQTETAELQKGEVCFSLGNRHGQTPPMGLSSELLNGKHHEKYFEGALTTAEGLPLRRHGDILHVGLRGQYQSGGRADDGIKINGIKTSSTELEGYMKSAKIPGLNDVVIVSIRPPAMVGGEGRVVAFVVMDLMQSLSAKDLAQQCKNAISKNNPQLARLHDVQMIERIPLTASGKIKRQWLADHYLQEHSNLFVKEEPQSQPRMKL
jgi:acetyl-CoA synthetase